MSISPQKDPRAIRTQAALIDALKNLLDRKPYHKITVTELADYAGVARHTFYNHFQTKQDLLAQLIDSVLDQFFSELGNWNLYTTDPGEELSMFSSFFQAWKDNHETARLIMKVEIDNLLIDRLKEYFTKYYFERVRKMISGVDPIFAEYIINFNAYTLLGVLKPWFKEGMKYPPEIMAGLLMQLTGSRQRLKAIEKYKGVIK